MKSHALVAIVTLIALLTYFWMGLNAGQLRNRTGIAAPAMTGDPMLERALRVQGNTLEWLPIFLPSLWLFALYWNDLTAASLGLVWIFGRIIYALGYIEDASKRSTGFVVQAIATGVLLFGALYKAVMIAVLLSH